MTARRAILSAGSILLTLFGCGGLSGGAGGNERIVAASIYPLYVAALNVADGALGIRLVNMSAGAAGCPHDYQLTPAGAAVIEKAAALIVNGGGMDAFLDKPASANKTLALINASAGLDFLASGEHGHDNPHVWMSIDKHILQIKNIAKQLSAWDTVNARLYNDNARAYIAKLTELKEYGRQQLSSVGNKNIVISHDGFIYLSREFGLDVAAVIETSSGAEPGAADIIKVIGIVKKKKPAAVFVEKSSASPSAKTVSNDTGLPVYELEMIVSGADDKDAYVRAMTENITTLKRALRNGE